MVHRLDCDAADLVRLKQCAHNKYAINKTHGVQHSIIPNITAYGAHARPHVMIDS
jgi:hypothetical protein